MNAQCQDARSAISVNVVMNVSCDMNDIGQHKYGIGGNFSNGLAVAQQDPATGIAFRIHDSCQGVSRGIVLLCHFETSMVG